MNRVTSYFREVRSELKKVLWPTRKETVSLTVVVIVSVILITGMLWLMDIIIGGILRLVVS